MIKKAAIAALGITMALSAAANAGSYYKEKARSDELWNERNQAKQGEQKCGGWKKGSIEYRDCRKRTHQALKEQCRRNGQDSSAICQKARAFDPTV